MSAVGLGDKNGVLVIEVAISGESQKVGLKRNDVIRRVNQWREVLAERSIAPGTCVALSGDFSPGTATLLLALIANGNIAIPLTRSVLSAEEREERSVYATAVFEFDSDDQWQYRPRDSAEDHILLDALRERREAGLVLF